MNLIAKASYFYAGRRLRAGDQFTASPHDGKALVLLGRAKVAEASEPEPKPKVEPKPEPKPEPDDGLEALRAEAEAAGVTVDRRWRETRLRDEIETARGTYMTRDLRAEE